MDIVSELSFHDSYLLEVRENPEEQSYDFLLDFPVDWENNVYEKKILRFEEVTFYSVEQIQFTSSLIISDIHDLGIINKVYGEGRSRMEFEKRKIRIEMNYGRRIIEFSECKLIDPNIL